VGALSLPTSGLVYVDTQILIYTVERHPVYLLPITQPILREAARLRATIPGLRTSDALHAAAAILAGCHPFLTNDHGFCRIPGLAATILDELLAS